MCPSANRVLAVSGAAIEGLRGSIQTMNNILHLHWEHIAPYLYDVVIHTKIWGKHLFTYAGCKLLTTKMVKCCLESPPPGPNQKQMTREGPVTH